MAMMMAPVPSPKPQKVELGELRVVIKTGPIPIEAANNLADQYFGLLADRLLTVSDGYAFSVDEYEVTIEELLLELHSVERGSVVITIGMVGLFAVAVYEGVSRYPNFKQGFKEIKEDISSANAYVAKKLPRQRNIALEINRRDENGLLEEIKRSRHS